MAAERRAEVTWNGDLTSGSGTIERVGSGSFAPLAVSWAARTEVARPEISGMRNHTVSAMTR